MISLGLIQVDQIRVSADHGCFVYSGCFLHKLPLLFEPIPMPTSVNCPWGVYAVLVKVFPPSGDLLGSFTPSPPQRSRCSSLDPLSFHSWRCQCCLLSSSPQESPLMCHDLSEVRVASQWHHPGPSGLIPSGPKPTAPGVPNLSLVFWIDQMCDISDGWERLAQQDRNGRSFLNWWIVLLPSLVSVWRKQPGSWDTVSQISGTS